MTSIYHTPHVGIPNNRNLPHNHVSRPPTEAMSWLRSRRLHLRDGVPISFQRMKMHLPNNDEGQCLLLGTRRRIEKHFLAKLPWEL